MQPAPYTFVAHVWQVLRMLPSQEAGNPNPVGHSGVAGVDALDFVTIAPAKTMYRPRMAITEFFAFIFSSLGMDSIPMRQATTLGPKVVGYPADNPHTFSR